MSTRGAGRGRSGPNLPEREIVAWHPRRGARVRAPCRSGIRIRRANHLRLVLPRRRLARAPPSRLSLRFLVPYNGSLSLVSMANDRLLAEVFGLRYTPERVVGLLVLFAIPAGYFATTRRFLTALLAAVLSLPLLFYGRSISFFPGALNHNLALLAAIIAGAALNRGRHADGALFIALLVALAAAGGGVAAVAACLVHSACSRASLRRWIAVLVPSGLYGLWWLAEVGEPTHLGRYSMSTGQTIRLVWDLAYSAFEGAALGSVVITWLLIAVFGVYTVWTLRKGLGASANMIAWSVGVVVWGIGLANNRGIFADAGTFRYRYTTLGLVLLAIVPRSPIRVPTLMNTRRYAYGAALLLVVLGTVRGLAVRPDFQSEARRSDTASRLTGSDARCVARTAGCSESYRPGARFRFPPSRRSSQPGHTVRSVSTRARRNDRPAADPTRSAQRRHRGGLDEELHGAARAAPASRPPFPPGSGTTSSSSHRASPHSYSAFVDSDTSGCGSARYLAGDQGGRDAAFDELIAAVAGSRNGACRSG